MSYVDGFVLLVPKKNLAAYKRISTAAGKVWCEHGALNYCECVGDDLDVKFGRPFPKLAKPKRGEAIVFSYIVYKSRAQRDKINAKVMADKRITMDMKKMPFDMKRMSCGGFKTFVEL